jgi:hypothetical protein
VKSRPWNSKEIAYLSANAGEGAAELARQLGRSKHGVEEMAFRFGISLRRGLPVCPKCGKYSVRDGSKFGWCRPCELRHYAGVNRAKLAEFEADERRREAAAVADAQRELWQARQQLKRARWRAKARRERAVEQAGAQVEAI